MKIVVRDIPDEGYEFDFSEELFFSGPEGMGTPVRAALRAIKSGDTVVLSGPVVAMVRQECSRCLKPVASELRIDFTGAYVKGPGEQTDTGEERIDDAAETGSYQGDEIDLTEIIREQVIVSLPMQPLCAPDCRGLCSRCGQNLNERQCSCTDDGTDDRWKKLKVFQNKP